MTRRALLIVNRYARRGRNSLIEAVDQLQELGFDLIEVKVEEPQYLSDVGYDQILM